MENLVGVQEFVQERCKIGSRISVPLVTSRLTHLSGTQA